MKSAVAGTSVALVVLCVIVTAVVVRSSFHPATMEHWAAESVTLRFRTPDASDISKQKALRIARELALARTRFCGCVSGPVKPMASQFGLVSREQRSWGHAWVVTLPWAVCDPSTRWNVWPPVTSSRTLRTYLVINARGLEYWWCQAPAPTQR